MLLIRVVSMSPIIRTFAALLLVLPVLQSKAEGKLALLDDAGFFVDVPSIESVTRLPQVKSETPAGVTIIDNEMIRASGARDLPNLLRMVPGFQVAYDQQDLPVVTYHGLGSLLSRRILLLIDGRSALGSFTGSIRWLSKSILLHDIERIEVIRGANTVTYGDNAFFATVNIITKHASKARGASLGLMTGDQGYGEAQASGGLHFERGDVRISAGYAKEDDADQLSGDFKKRFVNLRSDWLVSEHDSLLVQIGTGETSLPRGGVSDRVDLYERVLSSNYQQLQWKHDFGDASEFQIQAYHNYDKRDVSTAVAYRILGLGITRVPVNRNHVDERYDIEIEQTTRLKPELRTVWGIGGRKDLVKSEAYFYGIGERSNKSYRLFGNMEWRLFKDTTSNIGLLWEKNEVSDPSLSPRIAVNHHISDTHTIRAAFSRAKRQPSLFEEYGDQRVMYNDILLNQIYTDLFDVNNESVNSVELGYLSRFPAASLTLDTRLYQDRIYNFMVDKQVSANDRDGRAVAMHNSGDIIIDGFEFELTYQPNRDFRLSLSNALMKAHADGFGGSTNNSETKKEESVPAYSGSLFLLKRLSADWSLSLVYSWVGKMRWEGEPVEAYSRLDMRLSRSFFLGNTRGEASIVVQNAGDEYQDYTTDHEMDTHGYFSVKFGY